jgi:hypothetical protein
MSMGKISYVQKLFNLANGGNFLITLILFIVIAILITISLQFSENAYYFTLSSIFQGLFSILALAGIFVFFRIEQLSKDEAKYETDFKDHLGSIKIQTIPDLSSIGGMFLSEKYIMEWNEHNAILKLLDERKYPEYSEELKNLERRLEQENNKFEEELRKLKLEIEKPEKKGEFPLSSPISRIDIGDIENYRRQGIDALKICNNHVKECEKKGILVHNNRVIKSKILELFKMPFISGMILIAFTIFFLPMLNSNSGFWLQVPGNFVIGFLVSLTIMVIFKIMLLIYYSMWSDEAKKTLI